MASYFMVSDCFVLYCVVSPIPFHYVLSCLHTETSVLIYLTAYSPTDAKQPIQFYPKHAREYNLPTPIPQTPR